MFGYSTSMFARRPVDRAAVGIEVLAGVTTFLTMACIIFVQPAVLSVDFAGKPTGLDFGAVLLATCLASGLSTIFTGLWADYPIALAPGMGENFFFVSGIMSLTAAGVPEAWRAALGLVFVAGVIFLVLSVAGVREAIIDALSPSMRNGIAVGFFIAFIGLRNGGLIVANAGTLVGLSPRLASADGATFVENAAGVAAGGRTGLASVVTGVLFFFALLVSPLVGMIGSYLPITAPALVIVGAMMIQNVRKIDWEDSSEGIPAFLTMIGVPLSYSIADGLALGFVSYPLLKLLTGRARSVGITSYLMAALLAAYFVLIRGSLV